MAAKMATWIDRHSIEQVKAAFSLTLLKWARRKVRTSLSSTIPISVGGRTIGHFGQHQGAYTSPAQNSESRIGLRERILL